MHVSVKCIRLSSRLALYGLVLVAIYRRDEVKNPIPLPLPVFGPQNQPVVKVKRKPGRPKFNIQAIIDKLVQQREKQLKAAASKAEREAASSALKQRVYSTRPRLK